MATHSRQARSTLHCRTLWVLLFAVTLVGCGTQFIYNRAEWLAATYIGSQVSLDATQSRAMRASLGDFFDWHRSSELPRYADFLERLAVDAERGFTAARLDSARIEVEGFVKDAAARSAPGVARWAASLSSKQFDEFLASLGEDDDELREEYCGDPADGAKRRDKGTIKAIETWTGRLSSAQRTLVKERLASIEPTGCAWAAARVRSRTEFRTMIETHKDASDYVQVVSRFLTQPEVRWTPEYRIAFERNRGIVIDMLADLNATLEPEQRERAARKLRDYARDFRELASQPTRAVRTAGR